MKDSFLMVQGEERSRHRDVEAWESLGTFESLPSSSEWIAPRIESWIAKRKRIGEEWYTAYKPRRGFSATQKSLSYILKATVASEGLWASVWCSRGRLTAYLHATPRREKQGSNTSIASPQRKGTDLSFGWNPERSTNVCGYSRYALDSLSTIPTTLLCFLHLCETQEWLQGALGHQADTLARGLEGGSEKTAGLCHVQRE